MEPTRFEAVTLRRPEKLLVRHQRVHILRRILEFANLTIDRVVDDPRAKVEVWRWFRVAEACAWESARSVLRERVRFQEFVRKNR